MKTLEELEKLVVLYTDTDVMDEYQADYENYTEEDKEEVQRDIEVWFVSMVAYARTVGVPLNHILQDLADKESYL